MNKARMILLVICMMAGVILLVGASASLAETDTQIVDVDVTINSAFGFTVDDTSPVLFGSVNPGAEYLPIGDRALGIVARSNNGVAWTMSLAGGPLTGATSGATILNSNFRFWHTTDNGADSALPEGILTPAFGTDAAMDAGGVVIYQSTVAEGTDEYIALGVGVKIIVPADQEADNYDTTLTLTMTDST